VVHFLAHPIGVGFGSGRKKRTGGIEAHYVVDVVVVGGVDGGATTTVVCSVSSSTVDSEYTVW